MVELFITQNKECILVYNVFDLCFNVFDLCLCVYVIPDCPWRRMSKFERAKILVCLPAALDQTYMKNTA